MTDIILISFEIKIESVSKNDKINIICLSFNVSYSKSISTLTLDFSVLDFSLIGRNF